jgi:hypothetical protein
MRAPGRVLEPLLFLAFINDLPESVTSNARLFADDCLLYRVVNSNADQLQLQEDLHQLEKWKKTWQLSFNADKCFTLHISKKRKPTEYNYLLHNQMFEETKDSKYLGVTISNDLSWANHTSNILWIPPIVLPLKSIIHKPESELDCLFLIVSFYYIVEALYCPRRFAERGGLS